MQATKHKFETNYAATVGFEFFSFNIKLNNEVIKLQIWDTCGHEIYKNIYLQQPFFFLTLLIFSNFLLIGFGSV